jgi:Cd2+/Zn2+-exporting ATPase
MTEPVTTESYDITGMDCADCARTIERGVASLDGVQACSLNFTAAKLKVVGDVPRPAVIARVRDLGYDVGRGNEESRADTRTLRSRMLNPPSSMFTFLALALVLPALVFDELLPMLGLGGPIWDALAVAAALIAGVPIARRAWRALTISREITMDVLMAIGIAGALAIGAYAEAGLVAALAGISNLLEAYTADRARDSLRSLMSLAPGTAVVLRPCTDCAAHLGREGYAGGPCPFCGIEEHSVAVADLRVGEHIVVKPGERVPMDGRVLSGHSALDQAPITGESMPVDKAPGDDVFAGSINGEGALTIEVTHLAPDTLLSRIIHMVEEAQDQRAPVQRFVDRFARRYTPTVLVLAALLAVIPPLVSGAPFLGTQGWLYRALELIVAACPCALVISTPVALVSAITGAARQGVLFKGGTHVESLSKIRAMAFDKTGTLTQGRPAVVTVRSIRCQDPLMGTCEPCADLLALASAVEQRSAHPLARAVVDASDAQGVLRRYSSAGGVVALNGQGIRGDVNGRSVFIGSHDAFDRRVPHAPEWCAEIDGAAQRGLTPMLVSVDDAYAGYIAVSDQVRESSRRAIAELKRDGIASLVMLTGDAPGPAARVARQVGVTEVMAGLLPAGKVDAVKALQRRFGAIAMVGDGVNDAPALATADVGIAMGAGGTAQALETADIALMADDLGKLPFAVRLSRATMRTIRFNVAFSIGVKLAFFLLVLLGLGSMWLAVVADMGATLLVTLNGMRLARAWPSPSPAPRQWPDVRR